MINLLRTKVCAQIDSPAEAPVAGFLPHFPGVAPGHDGSYEQQTSLRDRHLKPPARVVLQAWWRIF